MAALPTEAIISVTNRCDARCRMCNIWRLNPQEKMTAQDYTRLPNTLRNVNLTGGEALLRKDIVEIAHAIFESAGRPKIILATNGFRGDKTIEIVEQIRRYVPALGIAISLDGSSATHDHMRGVKRAHARALETISALQSIGMTDIRIGYTATPDNIHELQDTYELAQDLGVQFTATIAQNSEIYYATQDNQPIDPDDVDTAFGGLVGHRLRSRSLKNWFRAYFDHGVMEFARSGKRPLGCHAATDFFFLAPQGDLYPCLTVPLAIGNLLSTPFEELWQSTAAQRIRGEVSRCQRCWMVCTARTEIKRNPATVLGWILRQQAARRLGL